MIDKIRYVRGTALTKKLAMSELLSSLSDAVQNNSADGNMWHSPDFLELDQILGIIEMTYSSEL